MRRPPLLAAILFPLLAIAPVGALAGTITLEPVEDRAFGLSASIPAGWTKIGPGLYARGDPASDPTILAVQAAPVAPDDLWPSLLPQLGQTERPDAVGVRLGKTLDWTLYQVSVSLPSGEIAVHLALAADGSTTYIVLLQSPSAESDELYDAVFLPVLDSVTPLAGPASPSPGSLPYDAVEVSFPGGADDVTLAGTLTTPRTQGPWPAVVLLSGSGAQDRDESLAPVASIKPFALLADALTPAGFAVLRFDDRGVGGSTGDYASATIADLTADARAALDFLATRDDVDPARLALLGHSEGGIYAASLAASDPRLAFVVTLAGPARTGVELLVSQNLAMSRAAGASAADLEDLRRLVEPVMVAARDGDRAAVEAGLRAMIGAAYDALSPDAQALLGDRTEYIDAQVEAQLPVLTSDWFRSLLASDPGADWGRTTIPVLGVFGGKDVQVPAAEEAPAMEAALEAAGNADHEVVTLPEANHLFQAADTGTVAEYSTLADTFTPDLLPTIVEWLSRHTGG
jgi:pimeloyl-ACP methyl ester carboxylesterase